MKNITSSYVTIGATCLLALATGCDPLKGDEPKDFPCDDACEDVGFYVSCDTVLCGVDAADDPSVGGDFEVFGVGLGYEQSADQEATCEVVLMGCEPLDDCTIAYTDCLNVAPASECNDMYIACLESHAEDCGDEAIDCQSDAGDDFATCYSQATTAEEQLQCEIEYMDAQDLCECEFEACVEHEDVTECLQDTAARIAPAQVSENRWRIPRALIELELQQLDRLAAQAGATRWLNPQTDRYDGVKLWLIDEGDLLHSIGLRRGDVVLSVNGRRLVGENLSPAALAKLYNARRVELKVLRGGKVLSLQYDANPEAY